MRQAMAEVDEGKDDEMSTHKMGGFSVKSGIGIEHH
jgi:hypothetical protein